MPSKEFAEYVRETGFNIQLSNRMIRVLLCLTGTGEPDDRMNLAPYQALLRRGLVDFKKGEGFSPTPEGLLVAELLDLAGYNETINPNSFIAKVTAE